jgi:hypothetical protein
MSDDDFADLTLEEAREFLDYFLASGRAAVMDLAPSAKRAGVTLDYSLLSLSKALEWFAQQLTFQRVPLPADTPDWVRASVSPDMIEFDDASKLLIGRASYYFGECFARLPGMRWTTGDPEYAEKHMPVVTGFSKGVDLPPLMVVKNLMMDIVEGQPRDSLLTCIEMWSARCPSIPRIE